MSGDTIRARAEAKLIDAVSRFDTNVAAMDDLRKQLAAAEQRDRHLNTEICQLCDLLGIYPEMAGQAAERLRDKRKEEATPL